MDHPPPPADQTAPPDDLPAALRNAGIETRRPFAPTTTQRTVVVLGAPRGGTSMVAAALRELGVYMGERLGPVVEDVAFSEAIEARDFAQVTRLIAARDAAHPVWGWKRPSSVQHVAWLHRMLRSPGYVAVFRDPMAVGKRNEMAVGADLLRNMRQTLAHYAAMLRWINRTAAPCMLVSYEKAMLERGRFIAALSEFVTAGQDASARTRAAGVMRRSPSEYVLSARLREIEGFLDCARPALVSGWACFIDSAHPVWVRIMVNGKLLARVRADAPRPDVKQRGLHRTGACGFVYELPADQALSPGDSVAAVVEGARGGLRNSPRAVGA